MQASIAVVLMAMMLLTSAPPFPQSKVNATDDVFLMLAGGIYHTLALRSDGTVWAWGQNGAGQLGDGTTTNRKTPVRVLELTDVVGVAGSNHSLALKSDGTVWAWGYNNSGQLGDGTTTDRNTPVQVLGITGVVSIAAGTWHNLALKNDGTVWAWGYNNNGQLGDGTTTLRTTPVQVLGITGVVSIAAGSWHSLAFKNDGTVWAWGYNNYGQLGDGTTTQRNTPVQVSGLTGIAGLTGVVDIAAGYFHSLALKSDGTVWAWGSNSEGLLGNGYTTNSNTPVQVRNSNLTAFNIRPKPVTITTLPAASNIYKGQTLSVSTLSGGVASAPGSFSWAAVTTAPTGSGNFAVIFTPSQITTYSIVSVNVALTVIDKDGLTNLIAQASSILSTADVGESNGQYPQSAYNALSSAIIAAQVVENISAANTTQSAISDATNTLQSAVNTFNKSKIGAAYNLLWLWICIAVVVVVAASVCSTLFLRKRKA